MYDFTLNIVDKSGKELVKPRRCLCGDENGTIFTGVTSDVMSMIDSREAFLNPVACYLEYGKYDLSYDKGGGRNFIKPLLEAQIPLDKCVVSRWNGTGYVIEDKIYDNYYATVVLPEKLEQERIEQEQQAKEYEKFVQEYERFKKAVETKAQELIKKGYVLNAMLVPEQIFVMPNSLIGSISRCKEDTLFTMIVCCNEKSKEKGLEPVYTISLDGHRLKVSHNLSANGFRLFFSSERSNYNQAQRDGSEIIGEWTSGNNVLVGNWTCNNEKLELVCDNFRPDKFYYNYRDKDYFCFIRSTKKSKAKKK